jgi:hypothetical protein
MLPARGDYMEAPGPCGLRWRCNSISNGSALQWVGGTGRLAPHLLVREGG